ncbi:MAG TPA: haloacid dehalogenase-like hydrolase [Gemmatimonadales bacterium]
MNKLVLFDIDGTILLSSGAGRRAIVAAIAEELGDRTALRRIRFDGKTDPEIVAELLETADQPHQSTPARIESICRRYVELLADELARPSTRTIVMPGILELLDRLEQQEGVLLGLLTGNVEQGAALKLRAAGIDPNRFRVGAYGSDAARRPELPPIAARRASRFFGRPPSGPEVVIIGDTPADIACGECIEARALAVATGGYSLEALEACRPYAAFKDLGDTERVLRSILQG